jgi:hypothetical protein
VLAILPLALSACGGSGGAAPQATPPAVNTVISGVVSKGIVKNGKVSLYALTATGAKGALLQTVHTDDSGAYTATVNYSGPVTIEASGSYTDEATGKTVIIPDSQPLHAAVDAAAGSISMAVTPLTEIAYQQAGPTALTPAAIKAANAKISELFKVDILATQPCAADATSLASASAGQQLYTLALAAVSQMSSDAAAAKGGAGSAPSMADVLSVVASINSDIASTGAMTTTAASFSAALTSYVQDNPQTVATITIPSALASVGTNTVQVKLSLQGITSPAYGVEAFLDLPDYVTVTADPATGEVAGGVMLGSGVAAPDTSKNLFALVSGKYQEATGTAPASLHIMIIRSVGFGAGEFLTISCNVAAGKTLAPSDLVLEPNPAVIDGGSGLLSGALLSVSAIL